MKHPRQPSYESHPHEHVEIVPPIFRVGDETRNVEYAFQGERLLAWDILPGDEYVAQTAGWDEFLKTIEHDKGVLTIPLGTRNARSILPGTEAWTGEKAAVVTRVEKYFKDMYEVHGDVVTGFSWGQVGVTLDRRIFIVPPNTRQTAMTPDVQVSHKASVTELRDLIGSDETNIFLADEFSQHLENLYGNAQ